jgi:ribosome-associated heat shock protein Hsp15
METAENFPLLAKGAAPDVVQRAPPACHDGSVDSTRLDKWLWSVRMFKTRADAAAACHSGHVRVNGNQAKAAHAVRQGDRVAAHVHGLERDYEVTRIIDKRVGAPVAAECFVDHSPPAPAREPYLVPFFREAGAGRPTKKDRRQLDQFRQR